MVGQICLVVNPADLALCKNAGAGPSGHMVEPLWQRLPEELVDRILLFVPASNQARLRCVCKRWSQLLTSSTFREESNLIAFRCGHRNFMCCKLEIEAHKDQEAGAAHNVNVDIPGLHMESARVFCGAGLVGVAHMAYDGKRSLVCGLLNMANKTCRQLPPLPLNSEDMLDICDCSWQIWLHPQSEGSSTASSFQVFVMVVDHCYNRDANRAALYTCTGTTGWRTVCQLSHHPMWRSWVAATKGGYVGLYRRIEDMYEKAARMSWDTGCFTHLPDIPCASRVDLISDPGSDSADVFGYHVDVRSPPSLSLYRLDESTNTREWTCLYSGRPPNSIAFTVEKVTSVANMMIIAVRSNHFCDLTFSWDRDNVSWHSLAYHMQDGSCQWFPFLPCRGMGVCFWNHGYIPAQALNYLNYRFDASFRLWTLNLL